MNTTTTTTAKLCPRLQECAGGLVEVPVVGTDQMLGCLLLARQGTGECAGAPGTEPGTLIALPYTWHEYEDAVDGLQRQADGPASFAMVLDSPRAP